MIKKILKFVPGVAIPMGINFLLVILYAGFLTPGQYGILNVYLNTIQIVYALTSSIFQTASLRYYSIREAYSDETSFITTYLFGNIFATLLLLPVALLTNCFLNFNWWIIVISVGINGLFQFLCNLYRLKNQSGLYNMSRCVTSIASIVMLIVFSFLIKPLSYVWPIIAVYGSYGVLSFVEFWRLRSHISIKKISFSLLKESIQYGFPLIGVSVLGYIVSSCDQYFLLYFLGDEAVGNYALGHRLVDALVVNLLTMLLLVMTPELNKQHDYNGVDASCSTLKKMISAAIWIILPISFAIIIYADYIIKFIFPAYLSAAHIMQLVVFASMFHGVSMFTCKGLELVKHPKYIFYSLVTAAVINCAYNAVFIPIYGIDASAHSSLIAYIVYNILLILFTKKYYTLEFDIIYIIKCLITTGITVLLAYLMMNLISISSLWKLIFEGIVCAITYVALSVVFKLFYVFK